MHLPELPARRSYTEACSLEHPMRQNIPGQRPLFAWIVGDFQRGERGTEPAEHDEDVTDMNEVRRRASRWVQRAALKVAAMIDEPGQPTGHLVIRR
jgi:hypothetical protein